MREDVAVFAGSQLHRRRTRQRVTEERRLRTAKDALRVHSRAPCDQCGDLKPAFVHCARPDVTWQLDVSRTLLVA